MKFKQDTTIAIAQRIMRRCDQLRQFSSLNDAYFRTYLTPEHRLAAEMISSWMKKAGMSARMDTAGNVVGRYEGVLSNMPAMIIGSHFDTVRDAGRYDGILGIVTAIECVNTIYEKRLRFPFAVEVYAFADEEGARFPIPFIGSRSVTGQLKEEDLVKQDAEGITLAEALELFGLRPSQIFEATRQPEELAAYVELHIEQGPCLEADDLSIAAVSGIQGQTFAKCILQGQAGHAGTVPMPLRRDALAGAAEAVLAVEQIAREKGDVVATVGSVSAEPGSANVIPGRVSFSIDLRAFSDEQRAKAYRQVCDRIHATAHDRRLDVEIRTMMNQPAISTDPHLTEIIAAACSKITDRVFKMTSGAGHDAEIMATMCPVGMIFVRCQGGISHHPAESVRPADVADGYQALLLTIEKYAAARANTGRC